MERRPIRKEKRTRWAIFAIRLLCTVSGRDEVIGWQSVRKIRVLKMRDKCVSVEVVVGGPTVVTAKCQWSKWTKGWDGRELTSCVCLYKRLGENERTQLRTTVFILVATVYMYVLLFCTVEFCSKHSLDLHGSHTFALILYCMSLTSSSLPSDALFTIETLFSSIVSWLAHILSVELFLEPNQLPFARLIESCEWEAC